MVYLHRIFCFVPSCIVCIRRESIHQSLLLLVHVHGSHHRNKEAKVSRASSQTTRPNLQGVVLSMCLKGQLFLTRLICKVTTPSLWWNSQHLKSLLLHSMLNTKCSHAHS